MKFITWDIGIVMAFGLLLAYALLIRKSKALSSLVSIYIAYTISVVWGQRVTEFFSGERVINHVWIQANLTSYSVHVTLLVLLTFLLTFFLKLGGKRARYSPLEVITYSLSTILLAIIFIISFMPQSLAQQVLTQSKLIPYIYTWRDAILVLPVFLMVLFGIYGNEEN